jgi:hypothetical protein
MCRYAECCVSLILMLSVILLSVIMLSVIMLSVIMLSVIMLSVIMPSFIMLNVGILSVVAPFIIYDNDTMCQRYKDIYSFITDAAAAYLILMGPIS